MRCTRVTVLRMSKMIQIRSVSDETHRTLKLRAVAAGMSLSDYIKRDLEEAALRPSLEEIDARVTARGRSRLRTETVLSALDEVRNR